MQTLAFDLGDALVWACAEFAGYTRGSGEPAGQAVPWADRLVSGGAVVWSSCARPDG